MHSHRGRWERAKKPAIMIDMKTIETAIDFYT